MIIKKKIKEDFSLVTYADPRSPVAEAYRTLRTNIQFFSLEKPIKAILIAGANPGCGKTTTTANLGVALAQSGSSVLLVDTDLRRPTLNRYFDSQNDQGLTTLLVDTARKLSEFLLQGQFKNLHILPSGPLPPNPAELLASGRMKNLVAALTETYDYVIFDSPPIIAVTDAAILSRMVDATIMVVDYGKTTRDEAAYGLEQLRKVQANVIGSIINGMPNKKNHYYYYQYYYGTKTKRKKR